ncbi:hypothetical protein FisN_19Hh191 [Fistulifera solaris]|uniref:MORN repeat protein n=1 Tax=Fistulifera solaris TaxID=1519565 RepID=A0A1Z5K0T3_FISSO|nr:hypothetical protein FisN_19Hh191 [Fistulifera solaris]|eukprot:GAX19611.1 hypothetical protein FisN_19Hh191 [Fistulifera solaris]
MNKEIQKARVTKGQCASCGQQLYRWKPEEHLAVIGILTGKVTSDANGRKIRKVPLTIPNLVEKGKCLKCAGSMSVVADAQLKKDVDVEPVSKAPIEVSGGITYDGPFNAKGERHGFGKMTWANGDVYEGNIKNNLRNGKGTMVFAAHPGDKSTGKYDGYWKSDMMHGKGSRKYTNGDKYEGEFFLGKRQGEGRFTYANGDVFWGCFEDNDIHGFGRYYYASGQRYEGDFFHGKRCGVGKLQGKDGRIEIFQYVGNERVGTGIRWSNDRSTAWLISANSNESTSGRTEEQISTLDAAKRVHDIEQAVERAKLEKSNA